jgi:hypothetical protein
MQNNARLWVIGFWVSNFDIPTKKQGNLKNQKKKRFGIIKTGE